MATKMAANFLENGCIHQISNHTCFYLVFGLKIITQEEKRCKQKVSCHFIMAKHQKYFQGPEHYTTFVKC